jgi:hypothetical protein
MGWADYHLSYLVGTKYKNKYRLAVATLLPKYTVVMKGLFTIVAGPICLATIVRSW